MSSWLQPDVIQDRLVLVVFSGPLQSTDDGVEEVNQELWSGEEESHQEDGEVGQTFLDVSPALVGEMFPHDVRGGRGVPDPPLLSPNIS